TKNFDTAEAVAVIDKLLKEDFFNADLFTTTNDFQLLQQNDKVKINTKSASHTNIKTQQHDKQKQRIIKATNNIYLHKLGITTNDGVVKKEMQDKYKQINRYTEIIDGIIKELQFNGVINVVDMGSGKGYLTFALYDYLTNTLQQKANITGIEMRPDLVTICNQIAATASFTDLHFEKGTIADAKLSSPNILIALHACDTATDDAIYKGIDANAKVIIVAPCCHKQIRRQVNPDNVLSAITKHGILLERQAEMVTDTIRALLLEANGYKTKVFEFINTEHTPKNVMIVGVKNENPIDKREENLEKVKELKAMFNIEQHYLEKLLGV
ncbi:MAG: SAM-dependent methyltransferase, partial [Bacteroidota bacterium]